MAALLIQQALLELRGRNWMWPVASIATGSIIGNGGCHWNQI